MMRFYEVGIVLALLVTSGHTRSVGKGCRASKQAAGSGKAAYFITNNDNNANSVIAVSIGRDGKLSGGTSTPAGGNGAVSIDGSTNATALKDGLVSQSSLSIAGNVSYNTNWKSG